MLTLTAVAASPAAAFAPQFTPSAAAPRCAPVLLSETEVAPSDLKPIAVVEAQLDALQRGEVGRCFDFASSQFRRVVGPRQRFEKILKEAPEYKPLLDCSRYEVLSTLQVDPQRWKCRVRVHNSVGFIPFSVEYRWELIQQGESSIRHDLGQCMTHKKFGYRGVVVGWDSECRQKEEWCEKHLGGASKQQPFYHVLVDVRDRPEPQMTYVAQEDLRPTPLVPIQHPYFQKASFTGEIDEDRGTYVPHALLREQYPDGSSMEGRWLVDQVFPDRKAGFDA